MFVCVHVCIYKHVYLTASAIRYTEWGTVFQWGRQEPTRIYTKYKNAYTNYEYINNVI